MSHRGEPIKLIIPDQSPIWVTLDNNKSLQRMVEDVVFQLGIRADRKNPQSIKVEVYHHVVQSGDLVTKNLATIEVMPRQKAVTGDEYAAELAGILSRLDPYFHTFVRLHLADRDVNMDDSLIIASEMVAMLQPAIEEYRKSMFMPWPGEN